MAPKWFGKKTKKKTVTAADLGLTEAEADTIASLLLQHAYHLPGNSWSQDLWQYLTNNHPLFGICFHHPLHPLKAGVRYASLIGSIFFGLALTCIIYTAFVFSQHDYDKQYIELRTNATRTGFQDDLDDNVSVLSVTNGNIALWTVGAFLHGLYDNTVWALAAGQCCACLNKNGNNSQSQTRKQREERFKNTGAFLVMLSVVIVIALTFFAVSLRQALTTDDGTEVELINRTKSDGFADVGMTSRVKLDGANDWEFIIAYMVELALSYFLYYPVIGGLLFSGVFTCGKHFQLTGGRPFEIARNDLEAAEEGTGRKKAGSSTNRNSSKKSLSSNSVPKSSKKIPASSSVPRNSNLSLSGGGSDHTKGSGPRPKKPTKAPALPSNNKR